MSRSGYSADCDNLAMYRGNVASALRGKRGQAFLREMAAALDALPTKRLIEGELIDANGECCAMGAVCKVRGVDVSKIDYDWAEDVGKAMGIAWQMAAEIAFMNDEYREVQTPEQRWERMRKWVTEHIL